MTARSAAALSSSAFMPAVAACRTLSRVTSEEFRHGLQRLVVAGALELEVHDTAILAQAGPYPVGVEEEVGIVISEGGFELVVEVAVGDIGLVAFAELVVLLLADRLHASESRHDGHDRLLGHLLGSNLDGLGDSDLGEKRFEVGSLPVDFLAEGALTQAIALERRAHVELPLESLGIGSEEERYLNQVVIGVHGVSPWQVVPKVSEGVSRRSSRIRTLEPITKPPFRQCFNSHSSIDEMGVL